MEDNKYTHSGIPKEHLQKSEHDAIQDDCLSSLTSENNGTTKEKKCP